MKKTYFILSLVPFLLLTACNKSNELSSEESIIDENSYPTINKEPSTLTGKDWFKYYGEREDCRAFPSKGENNVLVVPMLFNKEGKPGSSYSSSVIKDIKAVYNGEEGSNSFVSVKEYYERASYGQLKLNIDVVDKWCTLDVTLDQLYEMGTSEMADQSWYAVDYVSKWYQKNYGDINKYDNDKDGFIDSFIIIFGHDAYTKKKWPYLDGMPTEAEKALSWAYTFWTYENKANLEVPTTNAYNWISYGYMDEGETSKPDPHTYIHEFGHILGLDDYYDYDYQEDGSRYSPAGRVNMMDYNVGDQDSYSKYLLDWTQPKIVDKSGEITIKPFESSGDCILVPAHDNFTNSPIDEYLMIDLYTPTGLNESDSKKSKAPRTFSEAGIKIYHIDARAGKILWDEANQEKTFIKYIEEPTYQKLMDEANEPYYCDIVAANSMSRSGTKEEFKEINLLTPRQNSVNNYYYPDSLATNDDLYKVNDSITSFRFNNGNELAYDIVFKSLSSENATISFVKK